MSSPKRKPCKWCGEIKPTRARGLCASCHSNPYVRKKFPLPGHVVIVPKDKRNKYNQEPKLPKPTNHHAGSEEKIKVLIQRVADGLALWHLDDNKRISRLASKKMKFGFHKNEPRPKKKEASKSKKYRK